MHGYHKRPDATEELIWRDTAGRTFLKSGDIGRFDEEGFLFIKDGLSLTIIVTIGGFVIAMLVGLLVALGRMSNNGFARNIAIFYIETIRGIPVLVTIFMFGLVIVPWFLDLIGVSPQSFLGSNAFKTSRISTGINQLRLSAVG